MIRPSLAMNVDLTKGFETPCKCAWHDEYCGAMNAIMPRKTRQIRKDWQQFFAVFKYLKYFT